MVIAKDPQQGQLVAGMEIVNQLALVIAVARGDAGAGVDGLDQQVEIAAPGGEQPGTFSAPQRSFRRPAETGEIQIKLSVELATVALTKAQLHHRRKTVPVAGGKAARAEIDLLNKIDVDQADRPA